MFAQCTRCLHNFDAAAPNAPCPRCGNVSAAGPASGGGAVPKTMALDPSALADVLRGSVPSHAPPGPFGSAAPQAIPQPFQSPQPLQNPQPFQSPQPFQPPQAYANPQGYGSALAPPMSAMPATSQQPFNGYGAPQAYAPAAPSDRDLAGHAILSVVLAALAFLGACNLVGLAGVVLGLLAHNDANQGRPNAAARTKTARLVSVVALVLTVLAWGVGAAFLIFSQDAS